MWSNTFIKGLAYKKKQTFCYHLLTLMSLETHLHAFGRIFFRVYCTATAISPHGTWGLQASKTMQMHHKSSPYHWRSIFRPLFTDILWIEFTTVSVWFMNKSFRQFFVNWFTEKSLIVKTTFCFNMKSLLFFKEVKSCRLQCHWKPDCYVLNRWKILGTSVVSRSCFIDLSCPFLSAQWWKRCNHLTFHKGQHEKLKGLNIDNVCALTDISHLLWALRQKKKTVLHQRKGESPLDIWPVVTLFWAVSGAKLSHNLEIWENKNDFALFESLHRHLAQTIFKIIDNMYYYIN